MKAKTIPLLSVLILLASVVYGCWLILERTPARINGRDIFSLKENKTDFVVPTAEEVSAVKEINKKLILIANPQLDPQNGIDMKLFGEHKVISQYNYKSETAQTDVEFSYDITFTFVSTENRYCYINKKFYKQGDVMPDGGQINTIETNQVLIVKNNISEWIPVKAKASSPTNPNVKE